MSSVTVINGSTIGDHVRLKTYPVDLGQQATNTMRWQTMDFHPHGSANSSAVLKLAVGPAGAVG